VDNLKQKLKAPTLRSLCSLRPDASHRPKQCRAYGAALIKAVANSLWSDQEHTSVLTLSTASRFSTALRSVTTPTGWLPLRAHC